jgi:hypothetical protein
LEGQQGQFVPAKAFAVAEPQPSTNLALVQRGIEVVMINGPMSMPKLPGGGTDEASMNKALGFVDGLINGKSFAEICGERCGKGAARSVIIRGRDVGLRERPHLFAINDEIDHATINRANMASFGHHDGVGALREFNRPNSQFLSGRDGFGSKAEERSKFVSIWRHDLGPMKQGVSICLETSVIKQERTGGGNEDWVNHKGNFDGLQPISDCSDDRRVSEHSGLDGCDREITEHGINLRHNEGRVKNFNCRHPKGVLSSDCGNRRRAKGSSGSETVEVGLNARPSAGV